jgi:large subunit ribosomal protein L4e
LDMKVSVYSVKGEARREMTVAKAFSRKVRKDLIKRAVEAEQAMARQSYGTDPIAGQRTSAHYHARRGIRQSMMNRELARMKRIHGSGFLSMRARHVPQAVKGRKAHPPKAEKAWEKKMNKKERMIALLSAVAATSRKDLVQERGHRIEGVKHFPLVAENRLEDVTSLKEVMEMFGKMGLKEEIERTKEKKVRPGKGTMRGRKYKRRKGILLVIDDDRGITRAARNIAGVDVVHVDDLSVGHVAPGAEPGRLCVWTEGALQKMEELAK